jgi:hypothetical protein
MSRIIKRIYEIQAELANLNAANDDEFASMSLLLMEQVKLEQVKSVLSKALGRTIL